MIVYNNDKCQKMSRYVDYGKLLSTKEERII